MRRPFLRRFFKPAAKPRPLRTLPSQATRKPIATRPTEYDMPPERVTGSYAAVRYLKENPPPGRFGRAWQKLTFRGKALIAGGMAAISAAPLAGHAISRTPIELNPPAAVRIAESPQLATPRPVAPAPKPTPRLASSAQPEARAPMSGPLIKRWAEMVAGEVGLSNPPDEVMRRVARTVIARSNQLGWEGKGLGDILNPTHYQALGSKKLRSKVAANPEVLRRAEQAVLSELVREPKPGDPTHFYTFRKYKVSKRGEILRDKRGRPIPVKVRPSWAKGSVETYEWHDWTSENKFGRKNPMVIAFYRGKA